MAAAGNDSTTRPFVPAALAFNPDGSNTGNPLLVAVGALNASGTSVAAFSNEGDWVTRWAPGNAVVSTVPLWQGPEGGGLDTAGDGNPAMRRTAPDPDDLTTGFAVWAGTSFATPVIAGLIAKHIAGAAAAHGQVERGARAAEALAQADQELKERGWMN